MTPWFIATERFSPEDGQNWRDYIAGCGLTQLEEVVSLDSMLCPTVLDDIEDDYWPHIVNEDFMLNFFVDLAFLLTQTEGIERKNVLCVFRNPEREPTAPFPSFSFLGYDLVDTHGCASADQLRRFSRRVLERRAFTIRPLADARSSPARAIRPSCAGLEGSPHGLPCLGDLSCDGQLTNSPRTPEIGVRFTDQSREERRSVQ